MTFDKVADLNQKNKKEMKGEGGHLASVDCFILSRHLSTNLLSWSLERVKKLCTSLFFAKSFLLKYSRVKLK